MNFDLAVAVLVRTHEHKDQRGPNKSEYFDANDSNVFHFFCPVLLQNLLQRLLLACYYLLQSVRL